MRKFLDERGYIVTEDTLRAEFDEMNKDGGNLDGITFEQFVQNCTDKNGSLTEVKNGI